MRVRKLLVLTGAALGLAGGASLVRASRRRNGPVAWSGRASRAAAAARGAASIGVTHGTTEARKVFASAERRDELDRAREMKTAEQVMATLGQMKGAAMKLGQMMSYVDTKLPEPVREAMAQLQQDAPPMSPELSASVVAEELGAPPTTVFAAWDTTPIAAASIGQVHRAMTHDGRAVAVKVQYPGVGEAIAADLANSEMLMSMMRVLYPSMEPGPIVEEVRARIGEELDYRLEADNQRFFADALRGHPFIHVPDVLPELSTGRVLTTELAVGTRFDEVASRWDQHERDLAGETIFRFVFFGLYRLHVFNGDPHPGNYLFRRGGQVTFLDFGLVKRFTPSEISSFEDMARFIVVEPDAARARAVVEEAGMLRPGATNVSDEEVLEFYRRFYDPILEHDPHATYSMEFAAKMVDTYLTARFENAALVTATNVPASLVVLQRINLGLAAVLARLGSVAPFRAIAEELWPFIDGPASTPQGEAERAWSASRNAIGRETSPQG